MHLRATGPDQAARNTSPKVKKKPANEIVIVVDDEDEEDQFTNITRPGVGHGVLTRLSKS